MIKSSLTKALDRFDATMAAFLARYYQPTSFQAESEEFRPMQVDVRSEPLSEQETFSSDRHTHRLKLPGLQYDFKPLSDSSDLDGVLDAILPADGPLCIGPKPGIYDLSSYEVCSQLRIALLRLTQEYSSAPLSSSLRLHIVIASPKRMHT